jgi:hydrogenase nickel incorporation protein HypA/HybF
MHEVSVVLSLMKHAVDAAAPLAADRLRKIVVALGPLSGVEPMLMAEAFIDRRTEFGLSQCELSIENRPLRAMCSACDKLFEVVSFVFQCPACGSGRMEITEGDGMFLLRLEVEEDLSSNSEILETVVEGMLS